MSKIKGMKNTWVEYAVVKKRPHTKLLSYTACNNFSDLFMSLNEAIKFKNQFGGEVVEIVIVGAFDKRKKRGLSGAKRKWKVN